MPPWKPDRFCKSGVIGPACSSNYNYSRLPHCKPGYTCKRGFCCRDPVCPKGWIEGDSCNLNSGQKRCPDQYQCIKNFCCKERSNAELCPRVRPPKVCPVYKKSQDKCQTNDDCTRGLCCKGPCGWKFCYGYFPRSLDSNAS